MILFSSFPLNFGSVLFPFNSSLFFFGWVKLARFRLLLPPKEHTGSLKNKKFFYKHFIGRCLL